MTHTKPSPRKTISLSAFALVASGALILSAPIFANAAMPPSGDFSSFSKTAAPKIIRPPATDTKAKLRINPVAKDGSIVSDFTKSFAQKNRPVKLQSSADGTKWATVKTSKMDSKGVTTFKLNPSSTAVYRVVALKYKSKKIEAATPTSSSQWFLDRNYNFNSGDTSTKDWAPRNIGSLGALGRHCSAPQTENTSLTGGKARLQMRIETNPIRIAAAKAAGCSASTTVYSNAMVSTENIYTLKNGIVSARVKFPKSRGMHGGVWLQSYGGPELDMIESYGYGKGFTNVYHMSGENKVYKNNPKKSWYDKYHVFSLEFTTSRMIFRMDGEVTKNIVRTTPEKDYFLVMSLLSSDWELNKLRKDSLPASMDVDWVKVWKTKA